jgi:hypothetical protein
MPYFSTDNGTIGFGLVSADTPVVNVPPGARVVRIRSRPDDFISVYLRTPTGFEQWYVDFTSPAHTALRLLHLVARNERPIAPSPSPIAPL